MQIRLITCRAPVQVNLKREKLELSPVYSTAVDHDGHKLGYIRLVNFGQHAALDMQHAVQKLQACSESPRGPFNTSSEFFKHCTHSFESLMLPMNKRSCLCPARSLIRPA